MPVFPLTLQPHRIGAQLPPGCQLQAEPGIVPITVPVHLHITAFGGNAIGRFWVTAIRLGW